MISAKEYLSQIRLLDIHIQNKTMELEELGERIISISSPGSSEHIQSGLISDKMADMIYNLDKLTEYIKKQIETLYAKKTEVISVIELVDDINYYHVLHLRYIQYKKWETIACELGYDYRYVLKLHGRALQVVSSILQKRTLKDT